MQILTKQRFDEAALLIQRAVRGCLGRKRAGEKAADEMKRSCKRTSDCASRIKDSLQQLVLLIYICERLLGVWGRDLQ